MFAIQLACCHTAFLSRAHWPPSMEGLSTGWWTALGFHWNKKCLDCIGSNHTLLQLWRVSGKALGGDASFQKIIITAGGPFRVFFSNKLNMNLNINPTIINAILCKLTVSCFRNLFFCVTHYFLAWISVLASYHKKFILWIKRINICEMHLCIWLWREENYHQRRSLLLRWEIRSWYAEGWLSDYWIITEECIWTEGLKCIFN